MLFGAGVVAGSVTAANGAWPPKSLQQRELQTPSGCMPLYIGPAPPGAWYVLPNCHSVGYLGAFTTRNVWELPLRSSTPISVIPARDSLWAADSSDQMVVRISLGANVSISFAQTLQANPVSVVRDVSGRPWVTLPASGAFARLSQSGDFEYACSPTEFPPLIIIKGLDSLFFTEVHEKSIGRVNPDGSVWEVSVERPGPNAWKSVGRLKWEGNLYCKSQPTAFPSMTPASLLSDPPARIIADGNGRVWFTQNANQGVIRSGIGQIDARGNIRLFPIPSKTKVADIALQTNDSVWFTEPFADRIAMLASDGTIREYPLKADSFPFGLTFDGNGTLWFTEPTRHALGYSRATEGHGEVPRHVTQ